MPDNAKEIFVVHSKGDAVEAALASRLIEHLESIGLSVYEYADWQWSTPEPKVEWSSTSGRFDAYRYVTRHPRPFRRRKLVEAPDKTSLLDMLDECRVVALIAPRGGTPSEGVRVELEILPRGSTIVGATWGEHNDWIFEDHRAGYLYRIESAYDRQQELAALDLAHLVWLHWVIECMVREGRVAAYPLLRDIGCRESEILRILRHSERLAPAALAPGGAPRDMPTELVGAIIRLWHGRAALRSALPPASPAVQRIADAFSEAVRAFCEDALERHPGLAAEKASGLRLQATLRDQVQNDSDAAARCYEQALELSLPDAARSEILADRAAKTLRSSPRHALADIEEVLRLSGRSPAAVSQPLWLRGRLESRRAELQAAITDFSAALDVPEIDPVLRALCLHDRATAHERSADPAAALRDLDEAARIRDLPGEIAGPVCLDCAVLHGEAGDVKSELWHYARVLELTDAPDETRLKAHMYRGLTRKEQGDSRGALEDFAVILDDPAAPPEAKQAARDQFELLNPLSSSS